MSSLFNYIKENLKWFILSVLFVVSLLLWSVAIRENRHGILTVAFLNVGQGNATYIESPIGTKVLIDGGPNKTLMREISSVVPFYERHIDLLVVTNPDRDHYEGFFPLLDKYSVDAFVESGIKGVTGEYELLKKKISNKQIPDILARRGQIIDIGGGAYIEILFPDRDVSGLSTNDGSIVERLVYGNTSLILQGDSPQSVERYLISLDKLGLKSDVIELGHHGSYTSSSEEYLKAVSPEYAVISSAQNSEYGHPHKETLATLSTLKVPSLATCTMGKIVFNSDGKQFTLQNKKIVPVTPGCK
ncbi:MAG: MBL fold metallo-hydrolase [bacterium]